MLLYALTIFLSAFLLFLLEPLVAKMILPWFGGSAGVWTICLVFFQVVLLLGYLYAHGLTTKLRPRMQAIVHMVMLLASMALLPVVPGNGWKPHGGEDPAARILWLLVCVVGLPYFLLSSTGPLLQSWYTRRETGTFPYRLFALSNLASLLALMSYPIVIEPRFDTLLQAYGWSIAYGVFVLLCGATAWRARSASVLPAAIDGEQSRSLAPSFDERLLWLGLAACGSILLLAITNQLTQNIAAIPFLWILPLGIYLLTFILCFEGHGIYHRGFFLRLLAVALGSMAYYITLGRGVAMIQVGIPLFLGGLFVACMFCHGELAARKPAPAYLTSFYVMISLGGAIGAILVGVVAPHVFPAIYELSLSFLLTALLALAVTWPREIWERILWAVVSFAMAYTVAVHVRDYEKDSLIMVRNFYGGLRVKQEGGPDYAKKYRTLYHGTINHGAQFLGSPQRTHPTTYYGTQSGAGLAIRYGCPTPCKIGVIGLGTGTLAAYGRKGDTIRYYEINPLVIDIAKNWFGYLKETPAQVQIALGDARLSLEQEPPEQFDVLLVDAFSGDAIPVHLMTREAIQLYWRHMKPNGIIAFHVSNLYLDLAPVVKQLAQLNGMQAVLVSDQGDSDEQGANSDWVLVTSEAELKSQPSIASAATAIEAHPDWQLWTDRYNNLLQIVRWRNPEN